MNLINSIIGLIIQDVDIIHDYLNLIFCDGTIVNIYNNYHYDGGSILSLKGKTIKAVSDADDKIVFEFIKSGKLTVSLKADDYNGPEAMELKRKGESFVIWN